MLFTVPKEYKVTNEEIKSVSELIDKFEHNDIETKDVEESIVHKYLHCLVTTRYEKSIDEIAKTKIGSRMTRKRSLQQVMKESFFYGANRFGNNFIA